MALYLQSPTSVPATQRTGLYVDRAFIVGFIVETLRQEHRDLERDFQSGVFGQTELSISYVATGAKVS